MTLTHKSTKGFSWPEIGLFVVSALYAIFSYSLTAPNLILSSWPPYWQFQQWMWQTFFHNSNLLSGAYLALIVGLFGAYLWGLQILGKQKQSKVAKMATAASWKTLFIRWLLIFSPLLLSYNALSHDVFNYMFNAKMVLVYQVNPHVKVALDFFYDPWTRFMHNTHTPAPYGYGWTALSLVPSFLGAGSFLPTWVLFRAFAVVSAMLVLWALQKLFQSLTGKPLSARALWLVFCNPLFALEIISNQHNDLWMVGLALWSFALITRPTGKLSWKTIGLSAVILAASASIKFATVSLVPVWLLLVLRSYIPSWQKKVTIPTLLWLASVSLFAPLLTPRSQQFLPWYLTWSLVWLPFLETKRFGWWKALVVGFSLSAMLRYVPWLRAGEFHEAILFEQKLIVWGGAAWLWILWLVWFGWQRARRMR